MKLFFIILILAIFIVFGITIYFYYSIRHKLFFDFVYISKYLKNNISFNKNDLNKLLSDSMFSISNTSNYIIKNKNNFFSKLAKSKESKVINDFFESLGKGDVAFEMNNLDYYENIFVELEKNSKNEIKDKGLLYFKLIIGFGLIVCVLLL